MISVILPLYNVDASYLEKCLMQLHLQKNKDLEFIIVDDYSTNNVNDVIELFMNKDNRFRYYRLKKNCGVSVARNVGILLSKGDYLFFHDPDDFLDSNYFENMDKKFFNRYKDYDLIILGSDWTKKIVNKVGVQFPIQKSMVIKDYDEIILQILGKQNKDKCMNDINFCAMLARIYKKEYLVNNYKFCTPGIKKEQDCIFSIDFFNCYPKTIVIDHRGYNYRINENSICHRFNSDMDNILINTLNNYYSRLNKSDIADWKKQFSKKVLNMLGDMSLLKFNHPDNKTKYSIRKKQFLKILNEQIIKDNLNELNYKILSKKEAIKLFLLKHHFIKIYWFFLGK